MTDPLKFAVIGNPISHSLSPQIHQHFAEQFGIKLHYEAIAAPEDDFAGTIRQLQNEGYKGVNVTLPFKLQACEIATTLDSYAELADAANTLVFNDDNSINACNTDGLGLVKDLAEAQNVNLQGKTVLILGAGGAVQGIIKPLLDAGTSSITISNRTYSKAQTLAKKFAAYGEVFAVQQGLMPLTLAFDIVINATSASVEGKNLNIPDNIVTKKTVCYDLMYSQDDTVFIQWAKNQKVSQACDGLGMLIEQAAIAFYIWHGQKPNTAKTKKYLATLLNN